MKYYGKITDDHDLATKKYVDDHSSTGGTIEHIQVNGTEQTITDKTVNLTTVDNVTSTSLYPLTANQGKVLNDRIDNLSTIGRYLALWNCATGLPTTNPGTLPYTYKSGDYYRVSAVASSESTNYCPTGTAYDSTASTTAETESVAVGDVYFYDGTNWTLQINHFDTGVEQTANKITSLSASSTDIQYPSAKATYDYVNTNGGKIDHIQVNGTEQTITNKTVNLTVDSTPTSGSTNAVQSGGTYTALQEVKTYAKTQDGRRTRTDITNNLTNLSTAIAEQNLEKYGYTIGDYFTGASGYTYYLADMNTAYGGYNAYAIVGTPHCGVVVDTHSTTTWLSSGSASSYSASTLHSFLTSTALPLIKSDITALFGDWSSHMLARNVLDNSVGGWGTTWTGLTDCYLTAMSEVQMYGARVFGCDGYQTGTEAKPLELFMKYRWNEIYGNVSVWLKSLYSASDACDANSGGYAIHDSLTSSNRASGLILLY